MEKNFDKWNGRKKELHYSVFTDYVHTREVWWCSLGVNIGFEEDGKNELFERPVLVLKKFNKEVVLIVPLTTRLKKNIYQVNFVHQGNEFSAIISQMRLVSTRRLQRKIYQMDSKIFAAIRDAIKGMLYYEKVEPPR